MANFNLFIPILQQLEGEYQDFDDDKGNFNSLGKNAGTNHGISARFYEQIIKRPPTVADMKAITQEKAKQLYKKHFWDSVQGDLIVNQSVANLIVDHAVNAGEGSIGNIVQNILINDFAKPIKKDGDIGDFTRKAINSVNQQQLFNKIKTARASYYRGLGGTFLNSWLNRLKNFHFTELLKKKVP